MILETGRDSLVRRRAAATYRAGPLAALAETMVLRLGIIKAVLAVAQCIPVSIPAG